MKPMQAGSRNERTAAVAALLAKEGVICEGVSVAGANEDVAVIRCRDIDSDRLAALAPRIKALGFHWVTVDLAAVEPAP